MKKLLFFALFIISILFLSKTSQAICSIPSDAPLRSTMLHYANACGAEGDSSRQFSSDCSTYNTDSATATERTLYAAECSFSAGTT